MVDKQKKRHLTATISDSVYNMVEEYREQNKELVKPERSQIVEDALIAYIKSKKPQT
jgi:metal-responsive CopG/Arc/MetJ family transcriptional regulator